MCDISHTFSARRTPYITQSFNLDSTNSKQQKYQVEQKRGNGFKFISQSRLVFNVQTDKIQYKHTALIWLKDVCSNVNKNELFIVSESPLHDAHFYLGHIAVSLQTKS